MCRRIERSAIRTSTQGCGVDGGEWNALKVATVATVAQGKCIVAQERWVGGWNGMECNSIDKVRPSPEHVRVINQPCREALDGVPNKVCGAERTWWCDALRCDAMVASGG